MTLCRLCQHYAAWHAAVCISTKLYDTLPFVLILFWRQFPVSCVLANSMKTQHCTVLLVVELWCTNINRLSITFSKINMESSSTTPLAVPLFLLTGTTYPNEFHQYPTRSYNLFHWVCLLFFISYCHCHRWHHGCEKVNTVLWTSHAGVTVSIYRNTVWKQIALCGFYNSVHVINLFFGSFISSLAFCSWENDR